ncbi:hypothetical protein VNO77_43281 [Canavalia gladiata]|uniref:Secreted protein n=1 Tax=Canavalia gladiata TaxID=3824 RepID=A0AAN9PP90_CANGL
MAWLLLSLMSKHLIVIRDASEVAFWGGDAMHTFEEKNAYCLARWQQTALRFTCVERFLLCVNGGMDQWL